jgi:uncharacterized protein
MGDCSAMERSLTDALCTRCGLCCDGSLFADVELAGHREAARLELLGLAVEDGDAPGGLLAQPCAALVGRRCGIYAHRPECCRTFECRLLLDVRRGRVSVESAGTHIAEALSLIRRAKVLLVQCGRRDVNLPIAERVAEALAGAASGSSSVKRLRKDLAATKSALGILVRTVFLRG